MNKILEFFGSRSTDYATGLKDLVSRQNCPYLHCKCTKIRKSQPETAIGTCTVMYGRAQVPIVICPHRMLERRQIFADCLHLLNNHTPGNEIHVLSEISVPGGSVDYALASVKRKRVLDFVAIELQTLDTTGTVWPERQRLLLSQGVNVSRKDAESRKTYGMNWKMTAKTTLVQLHHKVQTFEAVNKHFVLVVQDHLLNYMQKEFKFDHLREAVLGDPPQIHAYSLGMENNAYKLALATRLSTDSTGISRCLVVRFQINISIAISALLCRVCISSGIRPAFR